MPARATSSKKEWREKKTGSLLRPAEKNASPSIIALILCGSVLIRDSDPNAFGSRDTSKF